MNVRTLDAAVQIDWTAAANPFMDGSPWPSNTDLSFVGSMPTFERTMIFIASAAAYREGSSGVET